MCRSQCVSALRANRVHLFLRPPVMSLCWVEIAHGGVLTPRKWANATDQGSPTSLREPVIKHLSEHHWPETTEREDPQKQEYWDQWEHTHHPLTAAFFVAGKQVEPGGSSTQKL